MYNTDKLGFAEPKPSPLGKVARRSRDGRGQYEFAPIYCSWARWYRNLFSQKSKIFASFPKGEALGRCPPNPNLTRQYKISDKGT